MPEPLTITEAAGFIRRGELTPIELLEQCFARIDRYDEQVRAWVYLDRDRARAEAERLTTELKTGHHRGPLHGIPIGVKDIIDVFDMPTGCGSKLWANSFARRDATVVERLRHAGAVIMGKTVTTAFASFDPPVTRNPWNLERTPGGSSSGSAAAVACGMCLGALATQTGGSITRPASYCGVYSIKPTYGRVSVDGVLPLAPSMDHVGAMANCVRDLAILLQTISGEHNDRDHRDLPVGPTPDYLSTIEKSLEPFGFWRLGGLFDEMSNDLSQAYDSALSQLDTGNRPDRSVPLAGFAELLDAHRVIMAVEAASFHANRLVRVAEDYPPRIRGLIEEGLGIPAVKYRHAFNLQVKLNRHVRRTLQPSGVFVTSATTDFAPTSETTGNPAFNSPWSFLGTPTVSFPVGFSSSGLPFSLQLVAAHGSELALLSVARWLEAAIRFERRPLPL